MPHIPALCALVLAALPATGQVDEAPPTPEAAVEAYLRDHGLTELLATHLLQRVRTTQGAERIAIADRLGRLYVELLESAATPERRDRIEASSRELLAAVPEADSFELRLNLAKVRYLIAEEIAERHRLRLAGKDELSEAEAILRTTGAAFADIGGKVHRVVEQLERKEQSGREENTARLRADLADVRRLRSLAMYYAGWANYYAALLSGRPQPAEQALTQFGWLLSAGGGRQASVNRVSEGMLKYEHVARAAIGSALCESVRGNDDTAIRWLEAIESAPDLPPAISDQLFVRRLAILAGARRWADLEREVRIRRGVATGKPRRALDLGQARLLAVLTMEAMEDRDVARHAADVVRSLAEIAIADLIELGEARHVLDLVSRYGTAQLGGEGFIVHYVRGLQAYERARAAHEASGQPADEPSPVEQVASAYSEAAGLLELCIASADGASFPGERTNAGLLLGLSLYYAGQLERAADRFEGAFGSAAAPEQAEEALWLAVVALDKAVERGRPSLAPRLKRLMALFLQNYPGSERSARLLLRQAGEGLVGEQAAADILLGVKPDSPLFLTAQRQAARLLYVIYRRARGGDRDFAALRFVEVSERLLEAEQRQVMDSEGPARAVAARSVVTRVRQVLDALLGMSAPDLARAEKAFDLLDAVAAIAGMDLSGIADELAFRRLQVALHRGREPEIERRLDELRRLGGRFADTADRMLYQQSLAAWNAARTAQAARGVVRHGLHVIGQFGAGAAQINQPAVRGLYEAVAGAAARVWAEQRDRVMLDTALRLDGVLLEHVERPSAAVLRRFAELSEAAGDPERSLEAWRRLMSGLGPATPEWFEARYHSLRLLALSDPARAREVMGQHKVLNPSYGPDPWGQRLRELDLGLDDTAPPPATRGPVGKGNDRSKGRSR